MIAQCRRPIEAMRSNWAIRLFQTSPQASQISAEVSNTRFDSHVCRRYCQIFSTGFSSGDFGGNGTNTMLPGRKPAQQFGTVIIAQFNRCRHSRLPESVP